MGSVKGFRAQRRHKGFRDVRAECQVCGEVWDSRNAQGVAARHTDATGHEVSVDISQHVTYFVPKK